MNSLENALLYILFLPFWKIKFLFQDNWLYNGFIRRLNTLKVNFTLFVIVFQQILKAHRMYFSAGKWFFYTICFENSIWMPWLAILSLESNIILTFNERILFQFCSLRLESGRTSNIALIQHIENDIRL